jgi:UDP-glucose 4-epimerase
MRVLISGKNSYISRKILNFFKKNKNFDISLISVRHNSDFNNISFNGVDIFIHLSSLVHKKEKKYSNLDYYNSNVKLTKSLIDLSIKNNVKHFIYFSSMSVFGNSKVIYKDTVPFPKSKYGKSKYEAEKYLLSLRGIKTKISIIRPPVVFGRQAPGNPKLLEFLCKYLRFIPDIKNSKSIIFINSLIQHVYEVIQLKHPQITHPQMNVYFSTVKLIELIRKYQNKKTTKTNLLNIFIYTFFFLPFIRKAFGNQIYEIDSKNSNFSQLYEFHQDRFKDLYE